MSTNFTSIPLIDISPLVVKCDDPEMGKDPGVCEVVKQLDQACRETGFFYVKGHGIPDSLIKEVRDITREYFDLPYEEKVKIKMSPATGYRGYQRVGENVTKGIPDMHEAIDCYREMKQGMYGDLGKTMEGSNLWPAHPPNFNLAMEEYARLCLDLSSKIMRGVALALGGSPYDFETKIAGDPFWVMRLIGYPGVPDVNAHVMPTNDIGCGAHTDYGLLTLVNQDDDITALEVRNLSGEWISAYPIPGTFVCNIGDMLKIATNGLYESTVHRVTNSSSNSQLEMKQGMYGDLGKTMEGSNLWPAHPPNFNLAMEEYARLCLDLSSKIMRGVALALGGSPYDFETKIAGDPFWVMRLIGYPGVPDVNAHVMPTNDIGCGAHTDYGLLTLVNQDDDITALEVRNLSGEWISAYPIPGTFVCNIGDMLKIATNGLYESTVHRVTNSSSKYRVCVAFFYETNFDAAVEPLDICKKRTGGIEKFGRAVYGEHLVSKVTSNFVT